MWQLFLSLLSQFVALAYKKNLKSAFVPIDDSCVSSTPSTDMLTSSYKEEPNK